MFMPKSTHNKKQLALEQLNCACELFLEGKYVSAISLGGCSESLAEQIVNAGGEKPGSDWTIRFIRFFRERSGKDSPSNKEIMRRVNWVKNCLKHHDKNDPIDIDFDAKLSSFLVIKRAIENMRRLGFELTPEIIEFNKATVEYG
jgi:hypothetical protein